MIVKPTPNPTAAIQPEPRVLHPGSTRIESCAEISCVVSSIRGIRSRAALLASPVLHRVVAPITVTRRFPSSVLLEMAKSMHNAGYRYRACSLFVKLLRGKLVGRVYLWHCAPISGAILPQCLALEQTDERSS